jgi:predicted ATPase
MHWEQTYSILSLEIPNPKEEISLEQLVQYESVRLFIERALTVNPKFRVNNENAAALTGICSQLDGIPLAIELAAARIKVLTVEKIYERLNNRFSLLTGGNRTALPRQQTLKH